MTTKHSFEYVMSGVSYSRITYPSIRDFPEEAKRLHHYFKQADGVDDHRFSLLYNAYCEKKFPIAFENFKGCYYKTHADSGGLQIITQGAQVDDEIKRKIYLNQAKYSDIAMSFDEIPLITVGGKSARNDMNTRFFDIDGYKNKAIESAQNLIDQIRVFKEQKTKAKPMMIIHGNNFQNANEWADIMLDIIPFEDHKYLGGIAMGGGSFGMAEKEMVLRTAVAANILSRHRHLEQYIHFLGIGSVRLMFATMCLRKNGWLKDVAISYDSTSHSSAPHMGRHVMKGAVNKTFTRELNQDYEIILNDIQRHYPSFQYSLKDFHENMTTSAGKMKLKVGSDYRIIDSFCAIVMTSVRNFQEELHRCDSNLDEYFKTYVDSSEWDRLKSFLECTDAVSYNQWDQEFGSVFRSKKIALRPTNLMDFV